MSAASDVAGYLVDNGFGSLGGTGQWAVYVGREPVKPDNVVTVYDSGGGIINADAQMYEPTIQIRVRSLDYEAGYARAEAMRDLLILPTARLIGDWRYVGFWLVSDVTKFGHDEKDRNLFSVNFRAHREPYTTD